MERKSKADIKNEYIDLDEMCGNGEEVKEFSDDKKRYIYPVPLKDFSEFMSNLGVINSEALWTNYLNDETTEAVQSVLMMSFIKSTKEDILSVVNAKNYPAIIKQIMNLNGIVIEKDKNSDGDSKKKE